MVNIHMARLAKDLDAAEEAEMERLVRGGDSDGAATATPADATTADAAPEQEEQLQQQEENERQPQAEEEQQREPGGEGVEGGEALGSNANAAAAAPPAPPQPKAAQPPEYGGQALVDVQQQAATIRAMVKTKRGIDTYKTYWKKYEVWHANRFGEAAPTSPYTHTT